MSAMPNVTQGMDVARPAAVQSYGSLAPIAGTDAAGASSAFLSTTSPNARLPEPTYRPPLDRTPPALDASVPQDLPKKRAAHVLDTAGEAESEVSREVCEPRKKKGPYALPERLETRRTRSWGACLRCRHQRIRCIPNPHNPDNPKMPCQACMQVNTSSSKVRHKVPCLRLRLQDIQMFRSGGLEITKRFKHTEVVDVVGYTDNYSRGLELSLGICQSPICVVARRFQPSTDDNLARVHTIEGHKQPVAFPLAPLCLSNVWQNATDLEAYLDSNAVGSLVYSVRSSDRFIRETYRMIHNYYRSLSESNPEKKTLREAICFCFALRHAIGSSWVSGGDTDGLSTIPIPGQDLDGKIPTPRMIIAQFDSIFYCRIFKYDNTKVLKSLAALYYQKRPQSWLTIFSITFLLLHYVPLASADRKRWAEQKGYTETRYGLLGSPFPEYVEDLQKGASNLLAYWHYHKQNIDLLSFDWSMQEESTMKHLTQEQTAWMKKCCGMLRDRFGELQFLSPEDRWDHELYYVSKMYEKTWSPDQSFQAASTTAPPTTNVSDDGQRPGPGRGAS